MLLLLLFNLLNYSLARYLLLLNVRSVVQLPIMYVSFELR